MKKLLVTGTSGLVGSAIVRHFDEKHKEFELLTPRSSQLNLLDANSTFTYLSTHKPEIVIGAAAIVGGIAANIQFPLDFLVKNTQMQNNLAVSSYNLKVSSFIFISSSCIYPEATEPLNESDYFSGPPDINTRAYGLAKINGMELMKIIKSLTNSQYISVVPCNLYGPNDNFHETHSHVVPALLQKFHNAKLKNTKRVEIWGNRNSKREFLHVDDFSRALDLILTKDLSDDFYNIGSGISTSLEELLDIIIKLTKFKGSVAFDSSSPVGIKSKLLNSNKFRTSGWTPKIPLITGIETTYQWMVENWTDLRKKDTFEKFI